MSCSTHKRVTPMADMPLEERRREPMRTCIQTALEMYFTDLNGHKAADVYQMVMAEVEPAMLETVLKHAESNQTRAAEMLGINRSTLRKKLRQYGIEP